MAAIDWDAVVALASELAATPEDAQDTILAYVNTTLAVAAFGGETSPKLKLVRVLLAAHMASGLTVGGAAGVKGPVTSETVGANSISRSYGSTVSGSGSDFESTPYGRQYLAIVRTSSARFPRVS